MDNPKYIKKDKTKCHKINISFLITFEGIIFATALLLRHEEEPTKSNIKKQLREILHEEGENYGLNGFEGYEIEEKHEIEAEIIAKKIFPKWIQS